MQTKLEIMREILRVDTLLNDKTIKGKTALKAYQRKLYKKYLKMR